MLWLGKPPKKKVKKFHNKCQLSPKMENPLALFHNNFSRFWNLKNDVFLQLLRVCEWGGLPKSLSKISLKSSPKQTDYEKFPSLWTKIWYCGGEVLRGRFFYYVRNSSRTNSNFLLGQKFVAVEIKFEFCEGHPPLAMPNSTNTPVSHIILY